MNIFLDSLSFAMLKRRASLKSDGALPSSVTGLKNSLSQSVRSQISTFHTTVAMSLCFPQLHLFGFHSNSLFPPNVCSAFSIEISSKLCRHLSVEARQSLSNVPFLLLTLQKCSISCVHWCQLLTS